MTAAHHDRPALELVAEPAAGADDTEWHNGDPGDLADVAEPETWHAQTVLNQWEPEHQLIGALMWMSAKHAQPILDLVPDTAIWRPTTRWAYQIIRGLVDEGRDPDPVVVLATAKHQPCSEAINPAQPPTPVRHHKLAVYLAAAYTQTISAAAAASYAREVLDEAYRRAFRFHGQRMQQFAESNAERDVLTDQFTLIRDELADLWRRCETAAKPGWDTP